MLRYLAKKIGIAVLVLFLLSLLVFGMVRLIPGDPAAQYLNTADPDPAQLAKIRGALGLDRPWPEQYLSWLSGVLQGDFGRSLTRPLEIGEQIAARLPASLELALLAVVFAILIGIPLGVLGAMRREGPLDRVVRGFSFLFLSIPAFVVGTLLVLINAGTLRLQLIGYVPFAVDPVRSLALMGVPALVLALPLAALLTRYTRNTLIDSLATDPIRTARAKGASSAQMVFRHALRNALIPVATVVGVQLGTLIGGTIIVENVFAIPGMGSLLIDGINSTDYPTIQGCILVLGALYVLINLALDLLYPIIDPRIRTV